MPFNSNFLTLAMLMPALLICPHANADIMYVGVASNFNKTAQALVKIFEAKTQHKVVLSSGSTGKLYTQIRHHAPYDVFLSADVERPSKLAREKFAMKESQFTYAIGQLVLLSSSSNLNPVHEKTLYQENSFSKLALANPKIAPYGQAALQTLQHLKLDKKLQQKFVHADNIMQAYFYIKNRNVSLGFASVSQVKTQAKETYWRVPQAYYLPIKQDAILLTKGKKNIAASEFLTFLKSPHAQKIIQQDGYLTP